MITLMLIIVAEASYNKPLFDSSLDYIENIQEGASDASGTIWKLYSNLGIASAIGLPPAVILMIYWDRMHSFFYVVMITAMLFVMNVSKLWYH